MTGTTIADFLKAGADDLWERLNKLPTITGTEDRDYWTAERDLLRDTVRLLRRCDDELTYRLTGERVLHGKFYDQMRIRVALRANGEYEDEAPGDIDEAKMRHPATADNFNRWVNVLDHDEEPAESETERYWRERSE